MRQHPEMLSSRCTLNESYTDSIGEIIENYYQSTLGVEPGFDAMDSYEKDIAYLVEADDVFESMIRGRRPFEPRGLERRERQTTKKPKRANRKKAEGSLFL